MASMWLSSSRKKLNDGGLEWRRAGIPATEPAQAYSIYIFFTAVGAVQRTCTFANRSNNERAPFHLLRLARS